MLNTTALRDPNVAANAAAGIDRLVEQMMPYLLYDARSFESGRFSTFSDMEYLTRPIVKLIRLKLLSRILEELNAINPTGLTEQAKDTLYAMKTNVEVTIMVFNKSELTNVASNLLNMPTGDLPITVGGSDVQIELAKSILEKIDYRDITLFKF